MDPLSLIGGIASAGAIIGGITKTVQCLSTIRGKFNEADVTLSAIISELSTIKAALYQIQDWLEYNRDGPIQTELGEALGVSLTGCKECLDLLAEDVMEIIGDSTRRQPELLIRTRTLWNEPMMKEHQTRLHHQISALQLLLTAVQVRSLAGQAATVRQPNVRRAIQQVKDDTSSIRTTLRASRTYRITQPTRGPSESGFAGPTTRAVSIISDPRLPDLDHQILETDAYRNHGAAVLAKLDRSKLQSSVSEATLRDPTSPTSTTSSERRQRPQQPRIVIPETIPVTKSLTTLTPSSTGLLTPDSLPRTPLRYSPLSPSDPSGSASKSPLGQFTRHSSPASKEDSRQQHSGQRPGLRAKIRSSFSRASLSPMTPTCASPTSPESTMLRAQRKLKRRGFDKSIEFGQSSPAHPLIVACQSGSLWDVERLLGADVDIDLQHLPTMRSALAVAAHCGHFDICHLLLDHGACTETVDCDGRTPLHLAVEHEHLEVAAALLLRGAKTQSRDAAQDTPLHIACRAGDHEMVLLLLERRADLSAKNGEHAAPLHLAARSGCIDVARAILQRNKHEMDVAGSRGMTALMEASAAGKFDMVRYLVGTKATLKSRCASGWLAIHWAAHSGHADVIELLLSKKALDARTSDGRTPLMLAACVSFAATDLLLRKGAHVNARCPNDNTALHYAVNAKAHANVRLLLGSGSDVEAEGHLSRRALHVAVTNGSTEAVRILLNHGAQVEARDAGGDRALCIAAANGQVDMLQVLVKAGASVQLGFDSRATMQDSPLCIACKNGHVDAAKELISLGARVEEHDAQHWTPLRYALYHAQPDVVKMLLDEGALLSTATTSYGSFSSFAALAPGIDPNDDHVVQIRALLRLAEPGQSALQNKPRMEELEGDHSRLGRHLALMTPQSAYPVLRSTAGLPLSKTPDHMTSISERTIATPTRDLPSEQVFSPISDSTYHIQMPSQYPTRPQACSTTSAVDRQRSMIGPISSLIPPLSTPALPSTRPGNSPIWPTTMQEREQLRRACCVGCAGMGREMPDMDCAKCTQNLMNIRGGQQAYAGTEQARHEHRTKTGPVYEMDATS